MGRVMKSNPRSPSDMSEEIQTPNDGSQAPPGRVHPLVRACALLLVSLCNHGLVRLGGWSKEYNYGVKQWWWRKWVGNYSYFRPLHEAAGIESDLLRQKTPKPPFRGTVDYRPHSPNDERSNRGSENEH